jgi:hypothetical protein
MVAHFVADWLLQNHWMATYKTSLKHPAAWVHSGIHLLAFLCIFQPLVAFLLFISHLLIDTRKPLQWWGSLIRQTNDPANPVTLHVAFWRDQVAHIALIALAVALGGAR